MSASRPPLLVIGIAGGSGSGKTTIATSLLSLLTSKHKISAQLLTMDYYYRDLSHLAFADRAKTNFDHPSSIENELLIHHLRELKQGRTVKIPQYNFATHLRCQETKLLVPPQVLIVEGILLFADEQLAGLVDLKVFVDCAADVRFMRRLQRDVKERGRDVESVCQQYSLTVQPMYDEFVAPSSKRVDIVVPNSTGEHGSYGTVVDLLCSKARMFVMDQSARATANGQSRSSSSSSSSALPQSPPLSLLELDDSSTPTDTTPPISSNSSHSSSSGSATKRAKQAA